MIRGIAQRLTIVLTLVAGAGPVPGAGAHGDLRERIDAVTGQILSNTATPELWLQRADLNRQRGDYGAAHSDLDHVFQLRPDWPAACLQRARIGFDSGHFAECEQAASDCLKLDGTSADAFVLRARSLVHLGKPALAVADYDAVLNVTNSAAPLPDLYLERAAALGEMARWEEAIAGLDAGLKRLGSTPSLALPAIEYERRRGAFDSALARLERCRGFFSKASFDKLKAEILLERNQSGQASPGRR
ncbi:MAG: hypothetical protein WCL44_10045 [bacterium]